jgi:hypothetical protein
LCGERKLTDLVEEHGSVLRRFEQAASHRCRTGKGAALVPKSSLSSNVSDNAAQLIDESGPDLSDSW